MADYSYIIDGVQVIVSPGEAGKPPSVKYSKSNLQDKAALTDAQKLSAEKDLIAKLNAPDDTLKAALSSEQIAALKKTYAPQSVGDNVSGKDVKIGTKDDPSKDPTSAVLNSENAKKIIDSFIKKDGGIPMDKPLAKGKLVPHDEIFAYQGLANLLYLVRGPQKNDGKYGGVSEDSWEKIIQKTHNQGGYKEDYEAFKKDNDLQTDLNSNQAYAFMITLIQKNESARFNVSKNLYNIADQLLISDKAGNGKKFPPGTGIESLEIFGNVFDNAGLKSKDGTYDAKTLAYAETIRSRFEGLSKYRWTNTDQEATLLGGPQPKGLGTKPDATPEAAPTQPTCLPLNGPDWFVTNGTGSIMNRSKSNWVAGNVLNKFNEPQNDADAARYANILKESGGDPAKGVLHIDIATGRPLYLVEIAGKLKVYDLTGERNDNLGLTNAAISKETLAQMKGFYEKAGSDNGAGYIMRMEAHNSKATNPTTEWFIGADAKGNFTVMKLDKETIRQNEGLYNAAKAQTAANPAIAPYAFIQGKGQTINTMGVAAGDLTKMFGRSAGPGETAVPSVPQVQTDMRVGSVTQGQASQSFNSSVDPEAFQKVRDQTLAKSVTEESKNARKAAVDSSIDDKRTPLVVAQTTPLERKPVNPNIPF